MMVAAPESVAINKSYLQELEDDFYGKEGEE